VKVLLRALAISGFIALFVTPALAQDEEAPAAEESAKATESGEAADGTATPGKRRRGRKRIWLPLSAAQRAAKAEKAAAAAEAAKAAETTPAVADKPALAADELPPTAPATAKAIHPAPAADPGAAHQEKPTEAEPIAAPPDEQAAQPGHAAALAPHAEHGAAHGEHAASPVGHGGGHGGHEGFKVGTFILQLINFGVLLFVLIYFGGRAMNKALRTRHEQLKIDIGEAARLRDEAKQKFDAQERRIANLEKEIASLRTTMRKDAEREQARMIEAAQERGRRMQEDMRLQIDEQVKMAEASLRAEVATASVKLAEELARKAVSFEDERRLAREFVASFDGPAGPGGDAR
jgi:F-type H+-transporting ATPase subunit b